MPKRTLSHAEARSFYDRFGAKQDRQSFYEDDALDALVRHADFSAATGVVEFGCGTGRFAERLLSELLPTDATYDGFDVSNTMVALAVDRLRPFESRATATLTEGAPTLPLSEGCCDRFVSTYVLDLLSEEDVASVVDEARRLLMPGGRLCLVGLTFGETVPSRAVCGIWSTIHSVRPQLVGGCRPLRLLPFLGEGWEATHREVVSTLGLASEIVVSTKLADKG